MDNRSHNHVILTVGNTILENNLDAGNKIRYISVLTRQNLIETIPSLFFIKFQGVNFLAKNPFLIKWPIHSNKEFDSNNNFEIEARLQNENKNIQNHNNT